MFLFSCWGINLEVTLSFSRLFKKVDFYQLKFEKKLAPCAVHRVIKAIHTTQFRSIQVTETQNDMTTIMLKVLQRYAKQ